jgi:hypothetical protein
MKNLIQFVIAVTLSLLMTSCFYDTVYEDANGDNGNPEVSYQADIIPLWAADCVSCHNGNEPPNLLDNVSYSELLSGYVVPGDADASILYKSLLGIDGVPLMPPGSMWPNDKIDLVKDWIDQGALNN